MVRLTLSWTLIVALLLVAEPATAQPADPAPPGADAPADGAKSGDIDRAKELFRQGVALFAAGDVEHALDKFERSRALYAASKNTINAAICLEKLQRYDEALELYEDAVARFRDDLDEDDKKTLPAAMARLRSLVASVEISANVDGLVVVDGRPRGVLPRPAVRVLAGDHVVRVVKDGYATAEAHVHASLGETSHVDVKLAPLAAAGGLRIEAPELDGAEVFVDGVTVGHAPWEGTIGPGPHVVWAIAGDQGSAPTRVDIIQGQTSLTRLKPVALGPETRIDVEPATAVLSIDGLRLGAGGFQARLPTGHHEILVEEDGYFASRRGLDVPSAGGLALTERVALKVDPSHPRWPKSARPSGWIGVWGGALLAPFLGSGAEASCPKACTDPSLPLGIAAAVRGGIAFPFGLSLELEAGYVGIGRSLSRTVTESSADPPYQIVAHDSLSIRGPFFGAGVSQRVHLAKIVDFVPRIMGGAIVAFSADRVSATASRGNEVVKGLLVDGSGSTIRSGAPFIAPEVNLDFIAGHARFGFGLAAMILLADGPTLPLGVARMPSGSCDHATVSLGCAQYSKVLEGASAYGPTVLFAPSAGAAWSF